MKKLYLSLAFLCLCIFSITAQDLPGNVCADAIAIDSLFGQTPDELQTSGIWDNTLYTSEASDPTTGFECFGEPDGGGAMPSLDRTIWFTFVGDGNTYRIRTAECDATDFIDDADTQVAVYTGDCDNLNPVACDEDQDAQNFNFNLELTTEAGTTYLMIVDGFGGDFPADGEFCLVVTNLTGGEAPPGEVCTDAIAVDSLFGQAVDEPQISGIYDNTNYTSTASDPTTGYECFGEPDGGGDTPTLDRTIWYTFVGDGGTYRIKTVTCNATDSIESGDTQIAVYSGDCANLTPLACNDDEDTAGGLYNINLEFMTEPDTTYLFLIDGFGGDFPADGEFCLEVTNLTPSAVTNVEETDIGIFPNPTTGELQITNIEADRVEVFDNTGRLVLTKVRPGTNMDISGLAKGFYYLKIIEGEAAFSAKVVKE